MASATPQAGYIICATRNTDRSYPFASPSIMTGIIRRSTPNAILKKTIIFRLESSPNRPAFRIPKESLYRRPIVSHIEYVKTIANTMPISIQGNGSTGSSRKNTPIIPSNNAPSRTENRLITSMLSRKFSYFLVICKTKVLPL